MKYEKAEYKQVMCCPECGWNKGTSEGDGMPDQWGFMRRTDEDGTEYLECSCGCKFVEE